MRDKFLLQQWVGALPCIGLLVGYSLLRRIGAMSGAMLGLSMCSIYIVYGVEKIKEIYQVHAPEQEVRQEEHD